MAGDGWNHRPIRQVDSRYLVWGKRIRSYREIEGLTQQQVADKLGVSRSTVMDWEHARRWPLFHRIVDLCNLLSVGVDDLV